MLRVPHNRDGKCGFILRLIKTGEGVARIRRLELSHCSYSEDGEINKYHNTK